MQNLMLPRGIRNNNPGNIRLGKIRWQGQKPVQTDSSFVEFESPVMGLRALMKVLLTYWVKYRLDTVESIINRYAPPHENATDHYIHHVTKVLKVKRRDRIDVKNPKTLRALAQSICLHENGPPAKHAPPFWYEEEIFEQACRLSLQEPVHA